MKLTSVQRRGLIQESDLETRQAERYQHENPERYLAQLARAGKLNELSYAQVSDLIKSNPGNENILEILVSHPQINLRHDILKKTTNPRTIDLVLKKDSRYATDIALNQYTSPQTLMYVYYMSLDPKVDENRRWHIQHRLSQNGNTPKQLIVDLANNAVDRNIVNGTILPNLIRHPNTPRSLKKKLNRHIKSINKGQ